MILRQFLHADPVAASYIVGCGGTSACAIVDPIASPGFYLQAAADLGMRIQYIIDTHVHADHLSTGRALAREAGARYVLHASVTAEFEFTRVQDGDRLEVGNVLLETWHVPGHTPEHIALLVTDRRRSMEPWCVLTGHTLLVGDMGRTELASSAEVGASALFESAARLKQLPDYVEVLPGAFAGSVCGRALSGKPMSTIGFERRFNASFAIADRDAFVASMVRDIPPPPPNAAATRAANLAAVPGDA